MSNFNINQFIAICFMSCTMLVNCAQESSVSSNRNQIQAPSGNDGEGNRDGNGNNGSPAVVDPVVKTTVFGDVNGDGKVDATDYMEFRASYGSASSDPEFKAAFDHNKDGTIGFADFSEFRKNFSGTSTDINQDGVVDEADFEIFKSTYGSQNDEQNYRIDCDFDMDGVVGWADFTQLRQDFTAN